MENNMIIDMKVFIGVGHGVDIGITENNRIAAVISHGGNSVSIIDFGPSTKKHIESLVTYLEHLKIHAAN